MVHKFFLRIIFGVALMLATSLAGENSSASIIAAPKKINYTTVVLTWYHGTTRAAAKNAVVDELTNLGYAKEVRWRNYTGSVSVALGLALSVKGYIDDEMVVIEKCSGTHSERALNEARAILTRLFPGGSCQQ